VELIFEVHETFGLPAIRTHKRNGSAAVSALAVLR
jgi:hypothetical protein